MKRTGTETAALFDASPYDQPSQEELRPRLLPGGFLAIPGPLFRIDGRIPKTEAEVAAIVAALLPRATQTR